MASTIRTLAKFDNHRLYAVDFFENHVIVTVTDTPSVIRRWIQSICYHHRHRERFGRLIVGLGVQWIPDEFGTYNPAETLQLCVGSRCLIIQLTYCDYLPQILRRFLRDFGITFVGIWNIQDKKKLLESKHQLEIGGLLDIRLYVENSHGWSLRDSSFETIVKECLGYEGVDLKPSISKSDWDRYILRHDQILQATVDAFVCFKLGVEERLWKET
ncbi:PREDICTED: uncharacterized protein LOC104821485 [Tarenaya hassleriana]|uniref:uncharacterized protein LOC104821485 n=1 Tax=Tarenaya hassleriana TaxID=28532 RepID=UPI00053CA831|nr:PREDICTED: uncharacterized protein LOC104821485 [Tarenaya hassleriana]XP_019058969.1 PREDICTED: uncharacterized protein LOC104821485 [Tarenaya hassleriana]